MIVLVGIQFFPTSRNQSDEILSSDFTKLYEVPNNINQLLETSCYDCHSNNTNYPWYSNLQPLAWVLEHHIDEGKEELNFSEFGSYSNRRKRNKLKSIVNQIKKDQMPLSSYTLLHGDARFSENEKTEIVEYIDGLIKRF